MEGKNAPLANERLREKFPESVIPQNDKNFFNLGSLVFLLAYSCLASIYYRFFPSSPKRKAN